MSESYHSFFKSYFSHERMRTEFQEGEISCLHSVTSQAVLLCLVPYIKIDDVTIGRVNAGFSRILWL